MKALSLSVLIASLLSITACNDASNKEAKIANPFAGHMKALEAAKDVERQILEAEEKRRKLVDELASPRSAN